MSEWVVLLLAMALACAVVVAVVVLQQRRVSEDDDPSKTPDVIEYMTMMIGVIYAIVLGLAIAGVWEARSAAQDDVFHEAQALHELSARAQVYPAPVRDRIRSDVDAYVSYVVGTEWRRVADGEGLAPHGTDLLDRLRRDVTGRAPRGEAESQEYPSMVDLVGSADEARQIRGQSAGPTMPGVVWFGLIAGALVTVGMIFALQIRRSWRELVLAGVFSALIVFLLFLIWDLDDPFGGGLAATTQPFLDLFPSAGHAP